MSPRPYQGTVVEVTKAHDAAFDKAHGLAVRIDREIAPPTRLLWRASGFAVIGALDESLASNLEASTPALLTPTQLTPP